MDDLNTLINGGQEATEPAAGLTDLVQTTPLPENAPPTSAIRNQAATTALLTGSPDNAMGQYQAMMQEGKEGGSKLLTSLSQQNQNASQSNDISAVYNLLANPNASFEAKQAAIKGFSSSDFLKDRSSTLQSNFLAAPSKGESQDSETARISVADELSKMYAVRGQQQAMVNDAVAKWPDRTVLGAFADSASQLIPFNNSVVTGKIAQSVNPSRGLKDAFVNFITPGTTQKELFDHLNELPTEQKLAYTKTLVEAIQNNSSFLFGNDNQANAYDKLTAMLEGGGRWEEFASNAVPLLDVFFAKDIVRGVAGAAEGVKGLIKGSGKASAARAEPTGSAFNTVNPNDTKAFNPKAKTAQAAEDVPFTESTDGKFHTEGVGPANQLPNPTPKLTAPVVTEGGPTPVRKLLAAPEASQAKIDTEAAVRRESPAAPGVLADHVNPEQSRNMYDAATRAEDPEVAKAFYNASPDQVVLNQKAGQVAGPTEGVATKVADIDQAARVEAQPLDDNIVNIAYDSGGDMYTAAERKSIQSNVTHDFENAVGTRPVDGMAGVKLEGGTLHVNTVYESPTGSWANADDAIESVKYGLKKFGILDEDITLLKKDGLEHVPVEYAPGMPEGDYKVRVSTRQNASNQDLINWEGGSGWEQLDVKRNVFDSIPQFVSTNRGSVNSWMVEAADQLHPTITGSAANVDAQAVRLDKSLLGNLKQATDIISKLDDARYAKMMDYIEEANLKEIDYNVGNLMSRGFNNNEITALQHWRDFWENHFFLENRDKVMTLRNQGFQVLDTGTDKFFARPIAKNGKIGLFYDPSTQSVRVFVAGELDNLYNTGGTIAELVRPVDINGQTVSHLISPQTPQTYLRGLRDADQVLNKKKGYFQRTYKAPLFIDRMQVNAAGIEVPGSRKTVAVAGDTKTAELFRRRMSAGSTDTYTVRHDVRQLTGHEDWDLASAQGRISQRYRGKLLEDATAPNQLGNSFVENPVKAAIRSAQSIANRTVSRPMIEATKERFIQQYGHLIPFEEGRSVYPSRIEQIGQVGQESTKEIADARTTWMYVRKLEQGYVNALDDASKAFFNKIADISANAGVPGAVERGIRAVGEHSLNAEAKKLTSTLYIALSPMRQLVLQAWQSVRVFSYNPIGSATGKISRLVAGYLGETATMGKFKGDAAFRAFVKESGLIESVDRHTLVNGAMLDIADSNSKWAKLGRAAKTPVEWSRRLGFDSGEMANRLHHLAGVFDRYERLGKDLTDRAVRANAYSEATALMGDMSRSGEMPYTSSTMSAALQFIQAPHKITTQMLNRRLDFGTRIRMLAADTAFFGVAPVGIFATWLGIDHLTGDNKDLRDWMDHGLMSIALNHMIMNFQDDSSGAGKIDFGSLDVRGYDGLISLFQNLAFSDAAALINGTPSGGAASGNRMKRAISTTARFFNPHPEYDGNNPTTFLEMGNSIMGLSSGWNNAEKAWMLLDQQKRADNYGKAIDPGVKAGYIQAFAQAMGFGSQSQAEIFSISKDRSQKEKDFKKSVASDVKEMAEYYQRELKSGSNSVEFISGVSGAILNKYAENPAAQAEAQKQLGYLMADQQYGLIQMLMKACDLPNPGSIHDQIEKAPGVTPENKVLLHKMCTDMTNIREDIKSRKEK